jgi:hypothetical protein
MPFVVGPNGGVDILTLPGGPELPAPGYSVMENSGIIEANPDNGPTAIVRYKCYSQDRYSMAQQLLGKWTGVQPANILYIGPFAYPPSPNLLCTSILSIEMHGKPIPDPFAGLPYLAKEFCIVTAMFTRPTWQAATSGGYFSITFSGSGEFFTLPETTYQFADGTPTQTPIGIWVGGAQITVNRFRMPFLPDYNAMPLIGYLNDAPFQIGNVIYSIGSLLFASVESLTESDVLGNLTYQFSYNFMFRQYDWNWYFHPNRTTGWAPVTDGDGNPPYPYGNFNLLP